MVVQVALAQRARECCNPTQEMMWELMLERGRKLSWKCSSRYLRGCVCVGVGSLRQLPLEEHLACGLLPPSTLTRLQPSSFALIPGLASSRTRTFCLRLQVIASIQMSHSLILAWWGADSVSTSAAQNPVCQAALLAGLPVEPSGHGGREAGAEGGRGSERAASASERAAMVVAAGHFCKTLLAHAVELPNAHANPQTRAFLGWDAQVQASMVQAMAGAMGDKDASQPTLACGVSATWRLRELVSCLCSKLARVRQTSAASDDGSAQDTAVLDQSLQRLLVLMADLTTDHRLQFMRAECEGWLRSLSASEDIYQQLTDVSNLRRVDACMQDVGRRQVVLDVHDTRASSVFEHCIATVRELVNDTKRSSALVVLYLDCSPVKSPRLPTPVHSINEALPEGEEGRGNIAALLHMLVVSSAPKIIRDVLRLFRTILEKPTSAALARLKPFVRRNVAESLAVMGRPELRALLTKLLLYKGMHAADSAAPPADAPAPTAKDTTTGKGPLEGHAGAAADTAVCMSVQATAQRRGTLRLLTLVLDGVDESIDRFASELVEALLAFVPALIRMPRPVLKECFAGIKFVCFRQSQACRATLPLRRRRRQMWRICWRGSLPPFSQYPASRFRIWAL